VYVIIPPVLIITAVAAYLFWKLPKELSSLNEIILHIGGWQLMTIFCGAIISLMSDYNLMHRLMVCILLLCILETITWIGALFHHHIRVTAK
jgi:hypothetical protein